MPVTLAEVRTRVRQRTDNEHTGGEFVTDAELLQLINTAYAELYGRLIRHSMHRVESTYTITADGSTAYSLPTDFYSTIGVFRTEGEARVRLSKFSERFRPGTTSGTASQYRVVGTAIQLYPNPASGTYEVTYIPVPGELEADDDTLDGVIGWEELVVVEAAIKVLEKEEADTSGLRQDKAELIKRIEDESAAAEFTESYMVENVRRVETRNYLEGDYTGRRGLRRF